MVVEYTGLNIREIGEMDIDEYLYYFSVCNFSFVASIDFESISCFSFNKSTRNGVSCGGYEF